MKLLKNKNKISSVIALSVVGVLVLASTISYATSGSLFGWRPGTETEDVKTDGENPPSQEQIENGNKIKEESVKDGSTSGSDQPSEPTTQADGKKLVELNIVSINRIESLVRVSVMISALDNNGTCTLNVKNSAGSSVYLATVQTQAQSNTSVCKGFDVPKANLPKGTYSFGISYTSGENYGNSEQNYVSE